MIKKTGLPKVFIGIIPRTTSKLRILYSEYQTNGAKHQIVIPLKKRGEGKLEVIGCALRSLAGRLSKSYDGKFLIEPLPISSRAKDLSYRQEKYLQSCYNSIISHSTIKNHWTKESPLVVL